MSDRNALARAAETTSDELCALVRDNPDDQQRAAALAARLADLRSRQLVRLVRTICEVRSTLTPRQREVLEKSDF
ncbi:MAG: hypothetical protein ACYTGW_05460 [Planctomycetota bacterium]|jgi:Spy/CpxP family protein refolding chaperone